MDSENGRCGSAAALPGSALSPSTGSEPSAAAANASGAQDEIECLRAALVHSMERFSDLAEIAGREPWDRYPLSVNFFRGSARRIEHVLNGGRYQDELGH